MIKYASALAVLLLPAVLYGMDIKKFHRAVASNKIKYVSKILTTYRDAGNAQGEYDETALHIAALSSTADMITLLLKEGGACIEAKNKAAETPLFKAVYAGNCHTLRALLAQGAEVNIVNHVESGGVYEHTPLHIAVFLGHVNIVKILLQAGADPAACGNMNATPLDYALEHHPKNNVLIDTLQNFKQ